MDTEKEENRVRIKHKKVEIKHRLPRLIDTSPGAFEKFQEEQKLKREKIKNEQKNERIKIKNFFEQIKKLKKLDDDAFDDYIREQLEKLKKKGEKQPNDELLRMNSFIYKILTDLKKVKNRKQKFNFVSPLQIRDYPIKEQEQEENDDDINYMDNKIDENNVLITTTFEKKIYKNLNKNT